MDSVCLPFAEERASPSTDTERRTDRATGRERVLVVEDEPIVRDLTCDILRSHGYFVVVASTGDQAVDLVGRMDPPDLLVTDLVMPGLNGRQAYGRLEAA